MRRVTAAPVASEVRLSAVFNLCLRALRQAARNQERIMDFILLVASGWEMLRGCSDVAEDQSVRRTFTGFDIAARTAWKLTVPAAIRRLRIPVKAKIHQWRSMW